MKNRYNYFSPIQINFKLFHFILILNEKNLIQN